MAGDAQHARIVCQRLRRCFAALGRAAIVFDAQRDAAAEGFLDGRARFASDRFDHPRERGREADPGSVSGY